MQYRTFGRTGVEVSEIGHGTWTMGSMWGPRDDKEAINSLIRSLELGVTFIDTAFVYGDGHSEQLIGKVFKQTGKKVFVATKVPPKNHQWPARHHVPVEETFPEDHIIEYTEKSLKNLQMDCVDLQQLHVWSDNWLPLHCHPEARNADRRIQMSQLDSSPAAQNDIRGNSNKNINLDWLEAVEKLKQQGKIKYFGVSINDHEPDSALKIVESGIVDSVQVIYNIFDQTPEKKLFPACKKHSVAVIARVPFDEGSLTGTLTPDTQFPKGDWRKNYFKGDRLKQTCKRVEKIRSLTQNSGCTLPQIALKFCLEHSAVSTVIPGMRKIHHVEDCCTASDGKFLTSEILTELKKHAWSRNFYPSYG